MTPPRPKLYPPLLLAITMAGCAGRCASPPPPSGRTLAVVDGSCPAGTSAVSYLKGQLHLHSGNSGDSQTSPDEVVRWYASRGYDFIVFTDHNRVTRARAQGKMLVMSGVELTQNLEVCSPPQAGHPCLLHLSALFVFPDAPFVVGIPTVSSGRRLEHYQRAVEVASTLGGLAQLNHPNFHYAADVELVRELARRGVRLLEVANESFDSNNSGDADHPSTEALWDAVLTARLTMWGVAGDDAHHYYDAARVRAGGEPVFSGDRGWVMVRAERSAAAIRAAVERGDFYASNGVSLSTVRIDGTAIELEVAAESPPHRFRFVGPGGRVLAEVEGSRARFPLAGHRGYVRAVATDRAGHKAWVQPVRLP